MSLVPSPDEMIDSTGASDDPEDFSIVPPLVHDEIQELRAELERLRSRVARLESEALWWRRWYSAWRRPLHSLLALVGMSSPR